MVALGGLGKADPITVFADDRLGWTELCAATEAAVNHPTRAPAHESARSGTRGDALAPARIRTDRDCAFSESEAGRAMVARIPRRRLRRMADLDVPVLRSAPDASASSTGNVLVVDGGHLVSSLTAAGSRGLPAPPGRP